VASALKYLAVVLYWAAVLGLLLWISSMDPAVTFCGMASP
jgi:hypothetical protein